MQHFVYFLCSREHWQSRWWKEIWMCFDWNWEMPFTLWRDVTFGKLCIVNHGSVLHWKIWEEIWSFVILRHCYWFSYCWITLEIVLLPIPASLDDIKWCSRLYEQSVQRNPFFAGSRYCCGNTLHCLLPFSKHHIYLALYLDWVFFIYGNYFKLF